MKKIYAISPSSEIEVLPLPKKQMLETYSGLVAPVGLQVEVRPKKVDVGGIMEVVIKVKSETCSELLRLPDLRMQRGLRYSFYISEEFTEKWLEDGREFKYRLRPLRADITTFPSLSFQILDTKLGRYKMVHTKPVPLEVHVYEGQRYFDVKSLDGVHSEVAVNQEGVWSNRQTNSWDNRAGFMIELLNNWFWWFLAVGPLVFLIFVPWARERYRRANDLAYARKARAYESFMERMRDKHLSDEGVGLALRDYLADLLECDASGFTKGDADNLLCQKGLSEDVRAEVRRILTTTDQVLYAKANDKDVSASSIHKESEVTLKALGNSLAKGLLSWVVMSALFVASTNGMASSEREKSWAEADRFFSQGLLEAETSIIRAEEYFASAALSYERAAKSGKSVGKAWYNAGNAWFKGNEPGRALAAYLRAEHYMPFDQELKDNLLMIRSLAQDEVIMTKKKAFWQWAFGWFDSPETWRKIMFLFLWLCLWAVLLFWMRYRYRAFLGGAASLLCVLFFLGLSLVITSMGSERDGVVIVDEVYGRKGPSYAYESAFQAPLHNALEVRVKEYQNDWLLIELENGMLCWLPSKSVEVF